MSTYKIQLWLFAAAILAIAARFGWVTYEEKQQLAAEHQQKCEKMGGSWHGSGKCLIAMMPDGFSKTPSP